MLLQSAAFSGVFTGFGVARDFEGGFAKRLHAGGAEHGSGSSSGTRSPPSVAGLIVAVILTIVAFVVGMNVGGGPVDLVGLYVLAALVNFCGFFWAGGLAMRFRTIQAAPLMQMPVFLVLFFAPVYVPLNLLQGWIEGVARVNPVDLPARDGPRLRRRRRAACAPRVRLAIGMGVAFWWWAFLGLRQRRARGWAERLTPG